MFLKPSMVENVVVVRDLLDRVTRLLLTMPVLLWQWHTGDVSTSAESPCHVLRVARAARVGVTCALSFLRILIFMDSLGSLRWILT